MDHMVLKISLEKELPFMTELVTDRAIMTQEILAYLLKKNEKRLLISLITKPIRPLFLPPMNCTR